jgi:hypothetical protein
MIRRWRRRRKRGGGSLVAVYRRYFDLDYAYDRLHPERRPRVMGAPQKDGLFLAIDPDREGERRNRHL